MKGEEPLTALLRLELERIPAVSTKGRLERSDCPWLPPMRPLGRAALPLPSVARSGARRLTAKLRRRRLEGTRRIGSAPQPLPRRRRH
jgi:hypothetical protein